jgi:EmrB/QacA subfamily drug resistance transporter
MTFLDFFIVNVALPSVQTDLHADAAAVSLVVAGYGLTFAAGMITGGRLGDLYGRRRMFAVGLILFTLTSLACGLAPNASTLVLARVLQGAAGAIVTPQVLAILGTVYTGSRRATAFAAYGFAMGIAGVLGQLFGGILIDADVAGLGWRAIFLINVPIGLATLAVVGTIPESRGRRVKLDLRGVALVVATVAALVLPLVEGREHGWPLWTWASFALVPVLAAGTVGHLRARARRGRAVLVDPALFRAQGFTLGSLTAMTFALVPPAFFFVLALYLQQGRGFSAVFSGTVFAAVGVGYFLALVVAAQLAARLGRQVLAAGAVAVAAGCAVLADAAGAASSVELLPGLALVGFGIGLVLVPVSSIALQHVPAAEAGSAAGVFATAQQVGGATGVAVIGVVFFDVLGVGRFVHAFTVSLWVIAALCVLSAALAQRLPGPATSPDSEEPPARAGSRPRTAAGRAS